MSDARLPLPLSYRRRPTRVVRVGSVGIGGDEPIRVQSMTTEDTGNVEATALQVQELAEAGCEIVRVTVPNMADAATLPALRERLLRLGVSVPLVADIHFNPHAAMAAADHVEKVRVNPGNYADTKRFAVREYTDDEYRAELDRIREKFHPLVEKCKRLGRAMRIGTNHGSLSDRIMNRYGDSPLGMVESALEFVRLCEELDYRDLVLSMKSSNPGVAIEAYRLLAARMDAEGMDYPFHLGVTEAGGGEDGRVKSAIGIGSLLADGIGDTIRVSLTEDPVHEVPVAFALVKPYNERRGRAADAALPSVVLPWERGRRPTREIPLGIRACGGATAMSTWLHVENSELASLRELVAPPGADAPLADVAHLDAASWSDDAVAKARAALWHQDGRIPLAMTIQCDDPRLASLASKAEHVLLRPRGDDPAAWSSQLTQAARVVGEAGASVGVHVRGARVEDLAHAAATAARVVVEACGRAPLLALDVPANVSPVPALRLAATLLAGGPAADAPLLLVDYSACSSGIEAPLLEGATRLGGALTDGMGDALMILGGTPESRVARALTILQVTRLRMTRPDYIACPSCGRTLFDLEEVTARIQAVTSHLKGVKIAIMGCIVNGPGEMADADFGYVGSAPGRINLYVGKDCVEKNVPSADAEDRLIELIKAHGRWVEPAGVGR